MKRVILIALLLTVPACASAPPANLYTVQQTRIYNTENAEQGVIAISQTAINLNASGTLSVADTKLVRDFSLAFDTWRTNYANGNSLVTDITSAFTALNSHLSTDATSNTLKAALAVIQAALTAIPAS